MNQSTNTPTVVLVHGGFADASYWAPVIKELQAHDIPVLAPPNPLRGLAQDAEYLTSFVNPTRSKGPCCWSATPTVAR
jgi:pimeloyl-ACP methyl ester carboxylesterase